MSADDQPSEPVSDLGLPVGWTVADMFKSTPDTGSLTDIYDGLGDQP